MFRPKSRRAHPEDHHIRVIMTWESAQGACRCGWSGPLRTTGAKARRDANKHLRKVTGYLGRWALPKVKWEQYERASSHVITSDSTGEVVSRPATETECDAWFAANDPAYVDHTHHSEEERPSRGGAAHGSPREPDTKRPEECGSSTH